jgi:hypothetical protein
MAQTKAGSPPNLPPLKFKNGSGDLMKELQKMVCLQVLEHITCYGKTKDKHKIWHAMHEKYYGPSHHAEGNERMSYVEKAHRGLEMFQFLYKTEDNLQGYAGPQRVLNQELLGKSADAPRIVSSFKEGNLTIKFCHATASATDKALLEGPSGTMESLLLLNARRCLPWSKPLSTKMDLPSGHNFQTTFNMLESNFGRPLSSPKSSRKSRMELMPQLKLWMLVMMEMTMKMRKTQRSCQH